MKTPPPPPRKCWTSDLSLGRLRSVVCGHGAIAKGGPDARRSSTGSAVSQLAVRRGLPGACGTAGTVGSFPPVRRPHSDIFRHAVAESEPRRFLQSLQAWPSSLATRLAESFSGQRPTSAGLLLLQRRTVEAAGKAKQQCIEELQNLCMMVLPYNPARGNSQRR